MTMIMWSENCPICGEPSDGCLMQMLMAGDVLTTEELMYLQKFDNLKDNWQGKMIPLAGISHYECYSNFKKGLATFLPEHFLEVLNWKKFPIKLLHRIG